MKGCSVILSIVVIIVLLAVLLSPAAGDSIPQIEDSTYVGSYSMLRTRDTVSWSETGEWTHLEYLLTFGGPTVCFGFDPTHIVFSSDGSHDWVRVTQNGRSCVRLVRK